MKKNNRNPFLLLVALLFTLPIYAQQTEPIAPAPEMEQAQEIEHAPQQEQVQLVKQMPPVMTGVEVLQEDNFKLLAGKRVGLITNPTGVDGQLRSTVDILFEAPEVELVALFGPEHGVRGDSYAGDKVSSNKDPKTGLPVFSLYGKTRKPAPEMLKGIDVLVYDIQDIGCRSFTYINTMGLAMEAAGEAGIDFVVLDRPNPLGGNRIEGSLVEDKFISFVSQYKIPYIYGLTCGELAKFLNGEHRLKTSCHLQVVPMKNWTRSMTYSETGLQWIASSPHIPHAATSYFYPISGIVGELGYLSIGVGYTIPFEMFGAPWIDGAQLADRMNALQLPGVLFRPIFLKPFYATFVGEQIQGVQVHLVDPSAVQFTEIQFYLMQELAEMYPDKKVFEHANVKRFNMFDKVSGSDYIRKTFSKRYRFDDIKAYWNKDKAAFKELSKQYYLYK